MKKQIFLKTVAMIMLGVFTFLCVGNGYVNASLTKYSSDSVSTYVSDTIAGFATSIRSSQIFPDEDVILEITKPNGLLIKVPVKAGSDGYVKYELNSYHTQVAGTYKVGSYIPNKIDYISYSSFQVFPDKASAVYSKVLANKNYLKADGNDNSIINVYVVDQYKNPIKNHQIKLISSRTYDKVAEIGSSFTNEQGIVQFQITSNVEGTSTITVMDLATGEVLNTRIDLIFSKMNNIVTSSTRNTNYQTVSLLVATASKFELSTDPVTQVTVGVPLTLIVKVSTNENQPATDYRGTIKVEATKQDGSTELNAVLPSDYTFTGSEIPVASHTYTQGIKFNEIGDKLIKVTDIADSTMSAIIAITVVSAGSTPVSQNVVKIISPIEGSTITENKIDVLGTATAFMKIKIFDNNLEAGNGTVDDKGNFTVSLSNLVDGTHIIDAKLFDLSNNLIGQSDKPVQFTVLSSKPSIKNVSVDPDKSTYLPGQQVVITVDADKKLQTVEISLGSTNYDLRESIVNEGKYTATVNLPKELGTYNAISRLTNNLGVVVEIPVNKTFVVQDVEFNLQSVNYEVVNNNNVKISFNEPINKAGISSYKVLYGEDQGNLSEVANIDNSKTDYTIVDLGEGKTYYFKFQIIGDSGEVLKEDTVKSVIIPKLLRIMNIGATPGKGSLDIKWTLDGPTENIANFGVIYSVNPNVTLSSATDKVLVDPSKSNINLTNLADNVTYYIKVLALDKDKKMLAESEEITGTPELMKPVAPIEQTQEVPACEIGDVSGLRVIVENNEKYLIWNPSPKAEKYKVFIGSESGNYNLPPVETKDTKFKIPEISKNVQAYYFAVTTICGSNTGPLSSEIMIKSGPAIFFLITIAIAGALFYRRMKKQRVG